MTTARTVPAAEPRRGVTASTDRVVDPKRDDHYGRMGMQPLDFILANDLDFVSGNVIKYVARGALGPDLTQRVTDLRKAMHYLNIMLERAERDQSDERIQRGSI